jgi:RNA polymerase sigma-70 factor (ECF subfamily)
MRIGYVLPNVLPRELRAALDQPTDGALIEAIARSERRAMRALYARHYVRVYRFIVGLTRDEPRAEDLVSEVFLEVWRKAGQFEGRPEVSTWLLAIARNKTYSALGHRADAQLDKRFAATIEYPADRPDRLLDKKGRSAVLQDCLSKLPPAHREIIDLVYYHEKSIEDVAQITGVPATTIKTRMRYAQADSAIAQENRGRSLVMRVCTRFPFNLRPNLAVL